MKHSPLIILLMTASLSAGPRSVAVFELANLSGKADYHHLSASLPKSLRISLLEGKTFQVIEPDLTLKALSAPPASGEGVSFNEALKAADRLKAEIAVIGTFALVGGTMQINLEAVDASTRRVKTSASVSGPAAGPDLFDLVDEICALMADRMAKELPAETRAERKAREVNVEEVYLSASRKNAWFFALCGGAASWSSFRNSDHTLEGYIFLLNLELGYGWKRFRIRSGGTPPVFMPYIDNDRSSKSRAEGGGQILLDYSILPGRLFATAGASFYEIRLEEQIGTDYTSDIKLNFNSVELGGRYRLFKPLLIGFRAGIPYQPKATKSLGDNKYEYSAEPLSMFRLTAEAEWMIRKSFGIKLSWSGMFASSKSEVFPQYGFGRVSGAGHFFQFGLIYNMEF